MIVNFIRNENDAIKNKINDMFSKSSENKIIVLGSVDDYVFEMFNSKQIVSRYTQYISIDKRYTTYTMLEDLLQNENTYIYNNNSHTETKKENIIFCEDAEEIEVLISSFEFTKDNMDNSNSVVTYFKGKKSLYELSEVVKLYEYYKTNSGGYLKLTKELLDELNEERSFRNSKINTIFEEMQMDEIISSFRNKANAYKTIYEKEESFPISDDIDIEINID